MNYFVAQDLTSSDLNDGLSRETAFRTIQKGVDVAIAGDIVSVLPGTYREQVMQYNNGTVLAPIVIEGLFSGNNRPIIKGSDVVSNWVQHSGTVWKAAHGGAAYAPYGKARQVFYKDGYGLAGRRLKRVGAIPTAPGECWNDDAQNTVYVWMPKGDSPNDYFMECGMRGRWMLTQGAYVQVSNFIMRHTSSVSPDLPLTGFANNGLYSIAEDCEFSWSDGACAGIGANHSIMRRCKAACGAVGNFVGSGFSLAYPDYGRHFTFEDNLSEYANIDGWSDDWACGNKFPAAHYCTFRRNVFRYGQGPGLWLDASHYCTIEENISIGNKGPGIMIEIGRGNIVRNNLIVDISAVASYGFISGPDAAPSFLPDVPHLRTTISTISYSFNKGVGIYVSTCADSIVENNTVMQCLGSGLRANTETRGEYREGVDMGDLNFQNNIIRNNAFQYNAQSQIYLNLNDGADITGNVCDYNSYIGIGSRVAGGQVSLADWITASSSQPGGSYDTHSIESEVKLISLPTYDGRLIASDPAKGAGFGGVDIGVLVDLSELSALNL